MSVVDSYWKRYSIYHIMIVKSATTIFYTWKNTIGLNRDGENVEKPLKRQFFHYLGIV